MCVCVRVHACVCVCVCDRSLCHHQMDTCSATISQKTSQVEENRTTETQAKVRTTGMRRERREVLPSLVPRPFESPGNEARSYHADYITVSHSENMHSVHTYISYIYPSQYSSVYILVTNFQ